MSLSLAPDNGIQIHRPAHQPVTAHFRLLHVGAGYFEIRVAEQHDHGMQAVEVHGVPHWVCLCAADMNHRTQDQTVAQVKTVAQDEKNPAEAGA
jgi:hypothetical protein